MSKYLIIHVNNRVDVLTFSGIRQIESNFVYDKDAAGRKCGEDIGIPD